MLFIHLHNLHFYSFLGVYQEEQLLGGDYEVNLTVGFEPMTLPITHLNQTIDYTKLYQLVKQRMAVPIPLLETVATEIVQQISQQYSEVTKISVSIKKLYPPINNFEGGLGVSFEWTK